MAATLEQIAEYLDNRGWNYEEDEENNRLLPGYKQKI